MSLMAKAMGVKVGNSLRKLVLIKLVPTTPTTRANAGLRINTLPISANAASLLFATILMRLRIWG